jgi:hypothetical protein
MNPDPGLHCGCYIMLQTQAHRFGVDPPFLWVLISGYKSLVIASSSDHQTVNPESPVHQVADNPPPPPPASLNQYVIISVYKLFLIAGARE